MVYLINNEKLRREVRRNIIVHKKANICVYNTVNRHKNHLIYCIYIN